MSNRRRPRDRAFRQFVIGARADAYAASWRCPDCASETTVTSTDGLPTVEVRHDDTCPWLSARATATERSRTL